VCCGSLSTFALHCLAQCALKEPYPSTFYSVAHSAMPKLTTLIDVAVAVKCFGVATSYLIVIGGLMPDVMEQMEASSAAQNRLLWVAVGFSVVAPLSFMKDLDSLKFTSLVAIFFVGFLTFLIILYASNIDGLDPCTDVDDGDECVGDQHVFQFDIETMKVFSIFVFGFTCHQNIFAVKNELSSPTISRINVVIVSSIGTAFLLYLLVGCFGYNTYGDNVESNILVNYPETGLVSTARLFVSLLVAFSYPLQVHPARKCILTLLSTFLDADRTEEPPYSVMYMRFVGITVTFLCLSFLIAMATSDLGVILSIVGATGSTIVSYILPGFVYYLTFKDDISSPKWKTHLALFQGILGLIIMPVCLAFIFLGGGGH
jgi:amino acid permease